MFIDLVTYDSGVPGIEISRLLDILLLFMFAKIRIGAFIMAAPITGARFVPVQVRIVTSVILTIPVMAYADLPTVEALTSPAIVGMVLGEIALGASAGLILSIFFAAATVAGDRIATTAGLGFAAQVDPTNGATAPVISQLFSLGLLVLFVSTDSHLTAFRLVLDSYNHIPPGTVFDFSGIAQAGIDAGGHMFAHAAKLMMPVVSVLLLVNMGIGVMTRSAPQLNIFSFGFPLTLSVTMVLLYLGAPVMGLAYDKLIEAAIDALTQMLTGAANG
jgi:flagellar biosynthetic protein FliR